MPTYGKEDESMIVIVMGVSASGKSTLAGALGDALGWAFIEGDSFHPPENIDKMRHGTPLQDSDRWPWLATLNDELKRLHAAGQSAVVACSALKQEYRVRLADGIGPVRFVYLCGNAALFRQRLQQRRGHFMPPDLLESQLATLEPPRDAILIDAAMALDEQVHEVCEVLRP